MVKLALFTLASVVRYEARDIDELLRSELEALNLPKSEAESISDLEALSKLWQEESKRPEIANLHKAFKKAVKHYFLDQEEAFEIRPGVQSLFGHMEKEKNWKYCIISPYPQEVSHLILQSCGVFSKNKLTLTATDAPDYTQQIARTQQRVLRKSAKKKIEKFLFCTELDPAFVREDIKLIQPKEAQGSPNYFTYPRFHELFPKKKKKNKNKKETRS